MHVALFFNKYTRLTCYACPEHKNTILRCASDWKHGSEIIFLFLFKQVVIETFDLGMLTVLEIHVLQNLQSHSLRTVKQEIPQATYFHYIHE